LVWATFWEDAANDLAGAMGLPALPVIHFDDDVPLGTSYKLPAIQRYVGDKPMAYLDDDVGHDVIGWARARNAPTLVIPVPADRGLQDEHVEALLEFADQVR
jgi:hypothetical protein